MGNQNILAIRFKTNMEHAGLIWSSMILTVQAYLSVTVTDKYVCTVKIILQQYTPL